MTEIFPFSSFPVDPGIVYPDIHYSGNAEYDIALGVTAISGTSGTWDLRWKIPETIPSGQAKIRLWSIADATSGAAKVNPSWHIFDPGSEGPNHDNGAAEGVTTVTWGGGEDHIYKETKIDLDAYSWTGEDGKVLAMELLFDHSGWTLAVKSVWIPYLIWE